MSGVSRRARTRLGAGVSRNASAIDAVISIECSASNEHIQQEDCQSDVDRVVQQPCETVVDARTIDHRADLAIPLPHHPRHFRFRARAGHQEESAVEGHPAFRHQSHR